MSNVSRERIVFLVSLMFLIWLYGFATKAGGWFPSGIIERAWHQATVWTSGALVNRALSPRVYDREGARIVQPDKIAPGLTLVSARWKESDWQPELRLINEEGRTVHAWQVEPGALFGDQSRIIHGFQLLSNGDVVVNLDYAGTVRLNSCSDVVWKLSNNSHHSIHQSEDENFWISGMKRPPARHSIWEVDGPGSVYREAAFQVSGDGRQLKELDLLDALADNESILPYLVRHQQGQDVTHLNDVEPLTSAMADEYPLFEAGDLLISMKHLNVILVLDPVTQRIKWHASEPFIQQHDPDFMGNGWIGVFDNREDGTYRGTRLGGSRVLALRPGTDSLRVLFPTPRSDPFFTPNMGTWQRLPNGNLLLTESRVGRVVEVASDGSTVWEWVVPPYDESTVPEVYQSTRYNITTTDVSAWSCSKVDQLSSSESDEQ